LPTPKIGRAAAKRVTKVCARGNYKGKSEFFDPDYLKRLQATHINGQQQQEQAIMPPPYMYQPQDLLS